MKTLLGIFILLFAIHTATMAQGSVTKGKNLEENREGKFLKDFKIRLDAGDFNPTQKFSIILMKNLNYALYLSNPSTSINNVKLSVKKGKEHYPVELKTEVNAKENYSVSRVKADETAAYHLFIEFNEQIKHNYVTMEIYLEEEK